LNKSDLLEDSPQLDEPNIFLLSAKTGKGVDSLLDHIADQFIDADNSESSITARERHLRSIGDAYTAFCKAEKGIVENQALDLVAEELLQAQNSLAEVTGEFTTEDLLGEIFKSFCIGK
jgi:Predicted GTPase